MISMQCLFHYHLILVFTWSLFYQIKKWLYRLGSKVYLLGISISKTLPQNMFIFNAKLHCLHSREGWTPFCIQSLDLYFFFPEWRSLMLKVIDEWCLLIFHYFIFEMWFSFSSLFLLVYDISSLCFLGFS